jgi:hypothetical protein
MAMSSIQQAQIQNKKAELIGEVRGKTVTTTINEISPLGVSIANNTVGQFTGKYTASQMQTVNVSMNRDGTSQYETKAIQNTVEGDFVVIVSKGTGKNTGPTTATFEGEAVFMTQSQRLAWLNTTKGWIEGTANNATGEFQATFYAQK